MAKYTSTGFGDSAYNGTWDVDVGNSPHNGFDVYKNTSSNKYMFLGTYGGTFWRMRADIQDIDNTNLQYYNASATDPADNSWTVYLGTSPAGTLTLLASGPSPLLPSPKRQQLVIISP